MELSLGIDIGGTKILAAAIDSDGGIISLYQTATPAGEGLDAVVNAVKQSFGHVLSANLSVSDLSSVGLASAGLVNSESGILFTSPHIPLLRDAPIRDAVEAALGLKTFLINDCNAAAIGEMKAGAAKGARNFIYITLSTGIGGAIVIDGKVYTGATGTAGEIGHMVIDDKGPLCPCGNLGCWETLASGTALAREAWKIVGKTPDSGILQHSGGKIDMITAESVYAAAGGGSRLAEKLIEKTGYYIGVGLANLVNIFNPELIVIGGGLAEIGDMLLQPAYREAKKKAFAQPYNSVQFRRAGLGVNSVVIGAALYAMDRIKEEGNRQGGFYEQNRYTYQRRRCSGNERLRSGGGSCRSCQ